MASERDCVDHLIRVAGKPNLYAPEAIALGLLVSRKWDRALFTEDKDSIPFIDSTAAARFDTFTASELDEFRSQALRILIDYTASLPRDRWSRGFWQGFASSWAYALSIALVAFIIELLGSDVVTVLRKLFITAR